MRVRMRLSLHVIMIAFQFLIYCLYLQIHQIHATTRIGYTEQTRQIVGYPPSLQSIAAAELEPYSTDEDPSYLTVGSKLVVKTGFCDLDQSIVLESSPYPKDHEIYQFLFADEDLDNCAVGEDSLKWFILNPQGISWKEVKSWNDLQATEITNLSFPNSIILNFPSQEHHTLTPILSIPDAAAGKRIGFTFTPKTKTGSPSTGSTIKVWDLDYFFGQLPQKEVGKINDDEGSKLEKTTYRSGGGWILESTKKPEINNLRLRGEYRLNESITAEYDFEPNTNLPHEVEQYIWWGELGTTSNPDDISLSTPYTNQSPPLTEQDIAGIIEVSILPKIIVLDEIEITGEIATQSALDDGNDLEGFYPFSEPEIKNLILEGIFANNYTLTAMYDFVANTTRHYEDKSLFWWGTEGTTLLDINDGMTGSPLNVSPPLNENDINQVYEVSVMPVILIEQKYTLDGDVVTQKTSDNGNSIQTPPTIHNLQIINAQSGLPIEANTLFLNDQLTATYEFTSNNNAKDQSFYQWRLNENTLIIEGNTNENSTQPIPLLKEYSGQSLTLHITAIDSHNLQGNTLESSVSSINYLPYIKNLQLNYDGLSATPNILLAGSQLSATYTFISGSDPIDKSEFNWRKISDDTLLKSGEITAETGNIPPFVIPTEAIGSAIRLTVNAKDDSNFSGNTLVTDSTRINDIPSITGLQLYYFSNNSNTPPTNGFLEGERIGGNYQFIAGDSNIDHSTYIWRLAQESIINSGNSNNQVIEPITIEKDYTGKIITLEVTPKDGLEITGKSVHIDLPINLITPPRIVNLSFSYPEFGSKPDTLRSGMQIGAIYTFMAGSNPTDKSTYEWYLIPNNVLITSGTVVTGENKVPEMIIPETAVGNMIELRLTAKDGDAITGDTTKITSDLVQNKIIAPRVENLNFVYAEPELPSATLIVETKISASYQFIAGSNNIDQSEFEWRISGNETLLHSGNVQNGVNKVPDFIIPVGSAGQTLQLSLTAKDGNQVKGNTLTEHTARVSRIPRIENLQFYFYSTGSSNPPTTGLLFNDKVSANYSFISGDSTVDKSHYEWKLSTGESLLQGDTEQQTIPAITIENHFAGKTLLLNVHPLDGINMQGEIVSKSIDISELLPPQIERLELIYPGQQQAPTPPLVGMSIAATYQFKPSSNLTDRSEFEWRTSVNNTIIHSGTIENNNRVPDYIIPSNAIGSTLQLSVRAKDGNGIQGNTETVSSSIIENKIVLPPTIRNLTFVYPGNSTPPEQLKVDMRIAAIYDFMPGSNYIDRSFFEWRTGNNSIPFHSGTVENGLKRVPEIIIPASAVGTTLQLTLRAEDGDGVRGESQTITSGMVSSNANMPPNISNLRFTYAGSSIPPTELKVDMRIGATYQFTPGSNNVDRSEYEWRTSSNNVVINSGIVDQGQYHVPDLIIPSSAVGTTLQLSVRAKDGNGTIGNTDTISSSYIVNNIVLPPAIRNLTFVYPGNSTPPEQLKVDMRIAAIYDFMPGSNYIDRSEYEWRTSSNNVVINSGVVDQDQYRVPDLMIPASAVGTTLQLTVKAKDGNGNLGNSLNITTNFINSNVSVKPSITNFTIIFPELGYHPPELKPTMHISAHYQFIPATNTTDRTEYEWLLMPSNQRNSGVVNLSGSIPVLNLSSNAIGNTLQLTLKPADGTGVYGDPQTKQIGYVVNDSPPVPGIAPQIIDLNFYFPDLNTPPITTYVGMNIAGFYQFIAGSNSTDRSYYEWRLLPDQLIRSGTIEREFRVPVITIQSNYIGRSLQLMVRPTDDYGNSGTSKTVTSSALGGSWHYSSP